MATSKQVFDGNEFDNYIDGSQFDSDPVAPASKSGFFRKAADLPLGFASGAVGAVKSLSDAFGANNAVSRGLKSASEGVDSLLTPEAKAAQQRQSAILEEAKGKGFVDQVAAGGKAFMEAPVQTAVQGLGSVAPFLAAQFIPGVGQSAAAARMAQIGMGVGMGAGAVKGSISDEVAKRELADGKTPEQAAATADAAQSYGGPNTDQILLGAGLGVADAAMGVTPMATKMLRQALGKEVLEQGVKKAGSEVAEGILKSGAMGAIKEVPVEFLQGGQEQVAANVAAQRAGYEAGTFDGAFSQGTLEGLASAGPGAGFGIMSRNRGTPPPATPPAPDQDTTTPPPMGESLTGTDLSALMGGGALAGTPDPLQSGLDTLTPKVGSYPGAHIVGTNTAQVDPNTGAIYTDGPSPLIGNQPDQGSSLTGTDLSSMMAGNNGLTGAPVAPPSEQLGINPGDGVVSKVAAQAVNTGVSPAVARMGSMSQSLGIQPDGPVGSTSIGRTGNQFSAMGVQPDGETSPVGATSDLATKVDQTVSQPLGQTDGIEATQALPQGAQQQETQPTNAGATGQPKGIRGLIAQRKQQEALNANTAATSVPAGQQTPDAGAAPMDAAQQGATQGQTGVGAVDGAGQPESAQSLTSEAPVLQNRDRSNPSSIAQMQSIASNPDYGRLGFSRDFANGAPVVAGAEQGVPAQQRGKQDTAVAVDGTRIPVQYAVVDAGEVLTSNNVDGTSNTTYGDANTPAIRAIAGNGRVAGLTAAYRQGTAAQYKQELMADTALHGVPAEVIQGMQNPVLVRVMPQSSVNANIGDLSNTQGNLSLSAVEQAKNDVTRVDLAALEFDESGGLTQKAVRQFVQAMPKAEQGGLIDTNGQPSKQAVDRLQAAVFAKAYGNDQLIRLFAQAQDPEARLILSAMAQLAPKIARLEGAGALDIRPILAQAAEIAVNARRDGKSIALAAKQMDMAADPAVGVILDLFASSPRSNKPIIEAIASAADFAYAEANKSDMDMFGEVQRASRDDVINQLRPQNERASQTNLEQPARRVAAENNAVGQQANDGATADTGATEAGRPAQQANEQVTEPGEEGLTSYTPAEVTARQDAATEAEATAKRAEDAAARAEAAAKQASEIAQRSVAAADTFELGGSAEDNLSGQGGLKFSRASDNKAARAALAKIMEKGVTSPDDLRALLRTPGYSKWAKSTIAGDLAGASALRGELQDAFPGTDWKAPRLNDQGIVTFYSDWDGLTAGNIDKLTRIADRFDAPVAARGGALDPKGPAFRLLKAFDFEQYMGAQERAERMPNVMFGMIRPAGGITATTPLFSQGTQAPRTPIAAIVQAITKAYGNALTRLQGKGLVTLTQTEDEALKAAAAERAKVNGTSEAVELKSLRASVNASMSPMKSIDANVRRGLNSLAKALDEKTSINRAMFRNGLGWVDFVWGDVGVVKPNGRTKGAMGISHILEARQRKDGMSDAEAVALLEGVVGAIASGTEFNRAELDSATRVGVEKDNTIVWLTKQKGSNAWVVTAYEKNPDGANAGRATSAPTSPAASRTRDQRVAGFADIMGLNEVDVKRSADGHLQGFHDPATGKTFMIADNLTAETAPAVFMHEVGIHMAADGKLQPLFDRALNLLKIAASNPFIKRVQNRMDTAGETSAEEAAAYIVEEYERDRTNAPPSVGKWIKDFTADVRAWLFSKGVLIKADQLTVADIAAVARANVRGMANGKAGSDTLGDVRNSKASALDTNIPAFGDIRKPRESVSDVASGLSNATKVMGNRNVPMDSIVGAMSVAADDTARAKALADKLSQPGAFFERVILDDAGNVIEGQHRVAALRLLGAKTVPAVVIKDYMRDFDELGVADAVRNAQKMGSDQSNRIVSLLSEIYADENGNMGEVAQYDAPKGYEQAWEAGIEKLNSKQSTPDKRQSQVESDITDIRRSISAGTSRWDAPIPSKFDDKLFKFQNKLIDLKRVTQEITKWTGKLADDINVYLQEELYHGRAAKRVHDFVSRELNPAMKELATYGMKLGDLEEYMHARHAEEANKVIAQRNPGVAALQDGGSGMTTAVARQYLSNLPAADKIKLDAVAKKMDAIMAKTSQMMVDYELESQDTIDGWDKMYKHYIPLHREDKEGGRGLGQGFSVKGRETKGRTGSTRKVVDIIAHIAEARERTVVRGEKNRVSQALVGLVKAHPNPEFWKVGAPPKERVFNPTTGLVEDRPDPLYKSRDNVVVSKRLNAKGFIEEDAVTFQEDDERAVRLAKALKNLDTPQLEGLMGTMGSISRYFAAINTQYNPVFGVVNLVRDIQGAAFNLGTTPLAGKQAKVTKDALSALHSIYTDLRATRKGGQANSQWASVFEQFQEDGGQTGFRQMFETTADRGADINKAVSPDEWMNSMFGKVITANGQLKVPMRGLKKGGGVVLDWLSDYNDAMENAIRVSAYKNALDEGMSREQAASLAKNITVNFNRKGNVTAQAGALYAFFNAAMQGTARLGETLFDMEPGKPKTIRLSPLGKKIVYGGMLFGSLQALALAGAGFGDDEPPEFVRERNVVIPIGDKDYITIPMPLGLHVIPGIGRHATEFALSGFKNPAKRVVSMTGMLADAFNPIGNAGLSMQTLAPTALDPLAALTENKDWTGKPIARASFNKHLPGFAQHKDSATWIAKMTAEAINTLSGGNDYVAGVFSPTPDQIDYLIGQVTGGVGRELSKVEQTTVGAVTGEDVPLYKMPLVGRFAGSASGKSGEASAFYSHADKINRLETEIKGLLKDGETQRANELRQSDDAKLIARANMAERVVRNLTKMKRDMVERGEPREKVRAVEERITETMAKFNRAAELATAN